MEELSIMQLQVADWRYFHELITPHCFPESRIILIDTAKR
jgi:hypothetical protein